MREPVKVTTGRASGRPFYYMTVFWLLMAATATFFQKGQESAVAIATARSVSLNERKADQVDSNVRQNIASADRWRLLSFVAVSLGILSWGIAIWRHENHYWPCVVILLSLYVILQLVMV